MNSTTSKDERIIEAKKAEITAARTGEESKEPPTDFRKLAEDLMRLCYSEANRLANHCSDGAARWAMENLFSAANEANKALYPPNPESL